MTDNATGQGGGFRPGGRRGAAGRQRDKLRRQRDDRRQRRNLLEKIQHRRAQATTATPFVITDTATGEVLRVPTEVLVRAADVAPGTDGATVVRDAGFGTDPVECLDDVGRLAHDLEAGFPDELAQCAAQQLVSVADEGPLRFGFRHQARMARSSGDRTVTEEVGERSIKSAHQPGGWRITSRRSVISSTA